MPPARNKPVPPSRYSRAKIAIEIRDELRRQRRQGGPTMAAVAHHLGLRVRQDLSHRLSGAYKLEIEEIGAIADFLKAPEGWPFIDWNTALRAFGPYPGR